MPQDHLAINRAVWDADAPNWVAGGETFWAWDAPKWGCWNIPEAELNLLPADMTGLDAIELGCGTGYVSAWMQRRGATVTGIDISTAQLDTARRLAQKHGRTHDIPITFLEGNAEETGLPDASFDFAISEYGAAIWCPPDLWLREAWRLLRPGGTLVFLGNHPLALLCTPLDGSPTDHRLHRAYAGMWGADWTEVTYDPSGISFNLTLSGWIALFADIGFEICRYLELLAPPEATGMRAGVSADWARAYPMEQVWHLRKPAA